MTARRSDGEPAMRSISSGAKRTTRSNPASPAARRPRPLTRIRLRPAVPVAPDRTIATSIVSDPTTPSTRARSRTPADQLAVGRRPVRAAPGQQDHRLEEARLAGRVRAPDEVRSGAERRVERRVAPEVEQVDGLEQGRPGRAAPGRPPGSWLGGGPHGHDDVDVVVVADRLEDAGRQRPVELERELVGRHVGQDVGQVAGVERDRRAVALDRGLDLADVVADLGVGADRDAGLAVGADLELDDVGRLMGDERRRTDGPQELLAIEDRPGRVARRARPAGSSGTGRRSAG